MPALVRWYERHAKDCVQAARRTNNLRHREHLLHVSIRVGFSGPPASIELIDAAENG